MAHMIPEVLISEVGPRDGLQSVGRTIPTEVIVFATGFDIAKMIGASREMVSRVMKDLQIGGFIEIRGSSIVLHQSIMLPD